MDGHLAVLHGQRALAIARLIGMEHGAVRVKLGSVNAVLQGADSSLGGFGGGGLNSGLSSGFNSGLGCCLGGLRSGSGLSRGRLAAGGEAQQQHSGQQKYSHFFHFSFLLMHGIHPGAFCPRVIPGL